MKIPIRGFLACWSLALLAVLLAIPAVAAPPVLSPVSEDALPQVFQAGKTYTLQMRFSDADGDRPRKAQFIDRAPSGTVTTDFARVLGTDYKTGVTLEWDIRGFEQGAHQASFTVTGSDGQQARYPVAPDASYTFVAESLVTKWIIMGAGLLVGLLFVPFLVYVLARSINRRGDPSGAARIGLLLGILACCVLFIYLFASFYGPLTYAIGIVAALALLVVVLTRR